MTRSSPRRPSASLRASAPTAFRKAMRLSFALIAYASSWMKCWHPDVFCAALLNAQPMGFYAPAQIVRDARDHGVEVRPVCINASRWDCTLEPIGDDSASRSGWAFGMVRGLANKDGAALVAARADRPFAIVDDLWRRSRCAGRVAGADWPKPTPCSESLGLARREALWAIKALRDEPLPLFAAAAAARSPDRRGDQRAGRVAEADDGRPRGGRGLRPCRPDAAPAPGELPAGRSGKPPDRHLRGGDERPRRQVADDRRPGAGAPAAGIRQGRHVHHHRGRDRRRQPGGLAVAL